MTVWFVAIVSLYIHTVANAGYTVSEFPGHCASGCKKETLQECEDWLTRVHPTINHNKCVDTSIEEGAEKDIRDRKKFLRSEQKTKDLTNKELNELMR